jgi:hypothetical protein
MSEAHTPGPWSIDTDSFLTYPQLLGECGQEIAEFYSVPSVADYNLIAAAPDLLEALLLQEEIYQIGIINGAHLLENARDKRRAAIAKAQPAAKEE